MSLCDREGTRYLLWKLSFDPRTGRLKNTREWRYYICEGPAGGLAERVLDAAYALFLQIDLDPEARAEFRFFVDQLFFDDWVSEIARQQDAMKRLELAMGTLWALGSRLDARKKAELERLLDEAKQEVTRRSPHSQKD